MGQERRPKITVNSMELAEALVEKMKTLLQSTMIQANRKFLVVSTGKKCIIVVDEKNGMHTRVSLIMSKNNKVNVQHS